MRWFKNAESAVGSLRQEATGDLRSRATDPLAPAEQLNLAARSAVGVLGMAMELFPGILLVNART